MNMTDTYLAIADADRIHDYVFAPRELKLIRGASSIQDRLNREMLPREAEDKGGTKIFAGGGTVLARFPTPDSAQTFCARAEDAFTEHTSVATVTTATGPYAEGYFEEAYDRLRDTLEWRKTARADRRFNGGSPFWAVCQFCGLQPAVRIEDHDKRPQCEACRLRREAGSRGFLHYPPGCTPPADFEALAKHAQPENYLVLVYLDVDRLGRYLKDHASASEGDFRRISRKIDEAVLQGVDEVCKGRFIKDGKGFYEILLAGGDDAILILPAQYGVPFVDEFARQYDHALSDVLERPSFSAALVYAHHHFPIQQFVAVADGLLKSAKAGKPVPASHSVNFKIITGSFEECVPEHAAFSPTARPYSIDGFRSLVRNAAALREAAPRSKLHALYQAAFGRTEQARLEYAFILSRLDEPARRAVLEAVGQEFIQPRPDGSLHTTAADLVEISEFLS
jgi:hypothetical protein